jgi:hypothetical protein
MSGGVEYICGRVRIFRIDVMRAWSRRRYSTYSHRRWLERGVWLDHWDYGSDNNIGLERFEVKVMGKRLRACGSWRMRTWRLRRKGG